MSEHGTGQVAASAAEIYEEFFVPALFGEWPARVLSAIQIGAGHRVLDIACGTGVLARAAARAVGESGEVVGIDVNEGMLAVARSCSDAISWETGAAEALPFDADSFDRVASQFGLMFFEDRAQAIREMLRVVRPGGMAGVAVWASLEDTPGYAAVAEMLTELFGSEVAKSVEVPYCLGSTNVLKALFEEAGSGEIAIRTADGKARFASVESWIYTDVRGWTLAGVIDDEGYKELRAKAPEYLSRFVLPDGSVEFSTPAHIVTIAK